MEVLFMGFCFYVVLTLFCGFYSAVQFSLISYFYNSFTNNLSSKLKKLNDYHAF